MTKIFKFINWTTFICGIRLHQPKLFISVIGKKKLHYTISDPVVSSNVIQEGVVSVCLCDTSGRDDLHINDLLVEEGYGVFAPDDWKEELSDSTNQVSS